MLNPDAVLELEQMLAIPLEDQATADELSLLGIILGNGIQALKASESGEEACAALSNIVKSAFVVGRRHTNHLM